MKQNKIYVFQNGNKLAHAAADLLVEISEKAIKTRGRFVISLSGGSTPENLFKMLAKPPYKDQIQWDKTFVFWGDERFVPTDNLQNNAFKAKTLLLNLVPIPAINIYPIPVDIEPENSAKKYENIIKEFFGKEIPRFDLIFLGLGENGHTASLFPESNVIFENTKLVKEVYVEEQNMYRITMTPLLINKAHHIIFLVEGENKAEILNAVLTGPKKPDKIPAQIIHPDDGNLYWFVDKKAASFLPADIENKINL